MIKIKDNFIFVNTKSTTLLLEIKDYLYEDWNEGHGLKFIAQRYYGKTIEDDGIRPSAPKIEKHGSTVNYQRDFLLSSFFGDGNNSDPSVLIFNSNNSITNRFFFKKAEVIKGGVEFIGPHARDVNETLLIVEEDAEARLELRHYYSVCGDNDVIVSKKELINHGDKSCSLRRFMSLECQIDSRDLTIDTFDGEWTRERYRHKVRLSNGVFINQSVVGSSSHKHNPFIEVEDNANNLYYGFNIIYSGNHKEKVEVDPNGHASIQVGINDFAFDFRLEPGASFFTPEAIMVIAPNKDDITTEMHNFINNHIINPTFANKERPIIFNSWEGLVFKINEKSLLECAELSKQIGVELFVMDDGWFKNRINDYMALGDWTEDKNKFPGGLGNLAEKVRAMGLQFGIWVEPEMISSNSDIYRAHPEFAQEIPGRTPLTRRHQLMIDMANPDVIDYLFDSLSKVLDEVKPAYVKWDYNRFITDPYSSRGVPQGEYMHRFMMGSYQLFGKLVNKYPDILFESCSSGGGRYDLGMCYYMPQVWASDNSSSYSRAFIGRGTLVGYPPSTLGAHVSVDGFIKNRSSLEDRFNINSTGAFGYEFDLRKQTKEDLEICKKQIEYFKSHQKLFQFGDYFSIDDCFDDDRYYSYSLVSKNKEEAIFIAAELNKNAPMKKWKIKGLNPEFIYSLEMRSQDNAKIIEFENMQGRKLLEDGIDLGKLSDTLDEEKYPGGLYSRMIYLKKIN